MNEKLYRIDQHGQLSPVGVAEIQSYVHGTNHYHNSRHKSDEVLTKLEATNRIPSKDKFRMMPCNTFIMCGACPYHERCVFLHDRRIKNEGWCDKAKAIPLSKSTKSGVQSKDTFYWPDMEKKDILKNVDYDMLPVAEQEYNIPREFGHSMYCSIHNRSMFSLWNYFTEFCIRNSEETVSYVRNKQSGYYSSNVPCHGDENMNAYIGKPRLECFRELSKTKAPFEKAVTANRNVTYYEGNNMGVRPNGVSVDQQLPPPSMHSTTRQFVDCNSPTNSQCVPYSTHQMASKQSHQPPFKQYSPTGVSDTSWYAEHEW